MKKPRGFYKAADEFYEAVKKIYEEPPVEGQIKKIPDDVREAIEFVLAVDPVTTMPSFIRNVENALNRPKYSPLVEMVWNYIDERCSGCYGYPQPSNHKADLAKALEGTGQCSYAKECQYNTEGRIK